MGLLQNADQFTLPLPPGTMPSSCEGGLLEVGDHDISLGDLVYHPRWLTETQVRKPASALCCRPCPSCIADESARLSYGRELMIWVDGTQLALNIHESRHVLSPPSASGDRVQRQDPRGHGCRAYLERFRRV